MDYINDLHELCESVSRELADVNEKIRAAGKMSPGDLEVADKLTHTLKSIKATIAMMEDEGGSYDDGRYSRDGYPYHGSYRGRSYARRRDSMGRYSNRGYSRDGDLVDQLHDLMHDAPNDQIKREMQKLAEKIEQQM